MRCFVAVGMPSSVRERLAEAIEEFKKPRADVRWVPTENMHLTLKFLGATKEDIVGRITGVLSEILSSYEPFYIKISGVGCFPDMRRPKIIWAGVEESAGLIDLTRDVDAAMVGLGYTAEKRAFSPHLTIGRVKSGKGLPELMSAMDKLSAAGFGDIEVDKVTLMKSELRPAGAVYSSLAEILFGGRKDVEQR